MLSSISIAFKQFYTASSASPISYIAFASPINAFISFGAYTKDYQKYFTAFYG